MAKPGFWSGNRTSLQTDWTDAQFKAIADMTRSEGLEMPNLGSYVRATDFEQAKRMIDVAELMGVPMVRIGVAQYSGEVHFSDLFKKDQECYNRVIEYARNHKVKPVIEIHMGTIVASASAALRFLSAWKPEEVGVIHDAGNMVYEGFENYQMGFEMLGGYLAHVHIKNSVNVYEPNDGPQKLKWKPTFAPLRTGQVDFKALLAGLKRVGYDRWLVIEDFSTAQPQETKVQDAMALLKELQIQA
jgi:sugar phosphate isomerase/epimerase